MKPTEEQKTAYAKRMSELLFEMRIESDMPYGNDCEPVPQEWGASIVDDPEHIVLIKTRIEKSILDELTHNPMRFFNEEKGNYEYHTDTFDHAFCVDGYLDELYEEQRQARLQKKWNVRIEIERYELDPETGDEDFIDETIPFGIAYRDSLEDALKLREEINKSFGEIEL